MNDRFLKLVQGLVVYFNIFVLRVFMANPAIVVTICY